MRRRQRRYQSNPTAREMGALVITTVITVGIGTVLAWWITRKLGSGQQQQQQQQAPQLTPPKTYDETPKGDYWA